MGKDHWDAIVASVPFNATAGRVVSGGYHFDPERPILGHFWEAQPPLRHIDARVRNNPGFIDYTGHRVGRLTVVGMAAENGRDAGALWVCRCACGCYTARRTKGLKTAPPDARCQACNYTAFLREAVEGDGARRRAEAPEARKW